VLYVVSSMTYICALYIHTCDSSILAYKPAHAPMLTCACVYAYIVTSWLMQTCLFLHVYMHICSHKLAGSFVERIQSCDYQRTGSVHIQVFPCTCLHIYIYIYVYIYICIHIHIHIHMHRHVLLQGGMGELLHAHHAPLCVTASQRCHRLYTAHAFTCLEERRLRDVIRCTRIRSLQGIMTAHGAQHFLYLYHAQRQNCLLAHQLS
jgi:hypothetical protein